MTEAPVTALYALPLVVLFIVLSVNVIRYRRTNRVALGTGDSPDLLARVRAQANCAEYLPLGLILLMLAEGAGTGMLFHAAAVLLIIGRFVHAAHLAIWRRSFALRPIAVSTTFSSYLTALAAAIL
jgi:uncharacterized protein